MNLPTVTFEPESQFDEEAGYSMWDGRGVAFDGKTRYALVRVADGQTPTAEKAVLCLTHLARPANSDGPDRWCVEVRTPYKASCEVCEVTLVRRADI